MKEGRTTWKWGWPWLRPGLGLTAAGLAGCVYGPPVDYYAGAGPPPPPPPPPPYHYEEPPMDSTYFGRRRPRGEYDFDMESHRRGRTRYLREVDPAYAPDPVETGSLAQEGGELTPEEGTPSNPSRQEEPTPPAEPPKKLDPADIPYATKADTPGRVKSPHPPYRELDVSGMARGSLAKDPTSGKVFRVP